jgi:hypothetical protein
MLYQMDDMVVNAFGTSAFKQEDRYNPYQQQSYQEQFTQQKRQQQYEYEQYEYENQQKQYERELWQKEEENAKFAKSYGLPVPPRKSKNKAHDSLAVSFEDDKQRYYDDAYVHANQHSSKERYKSKDKTKKDSRRRRQQEADLERGRGGDHFGRQGVNNLEGDDDGDGESDSGSGSGSGSGDDDVSSISSEDSDVKIVSAIYVCYVVSFICSLMSHFVCLI